MHYVQVAICKTAASFRQTLLYYINYPKNLYPVKITEKQLKKCKVQVCSYKKTNAPLADFYIA